MQPAVTLMLAAMLAALGPALAPAQSAFLLRRGADTIAVERFVRSDRQLTGELVFKAAGARFGYELNLDARGLPATLANRFWMTTDPANSAPRQSALMTFRGDSVFAAITEADGRSTTQRLASKAGAFPHLNPSFALWEPVLIDAKKTRKSTVSMFALSGGTVFEAGVEWKGPDSVVIKVGGGGDARIKLDAAGRILGGIVPAQGLVLERIENPSADLLNVPKPDYSAPADAPYTAIDVTIPTSMGHTLAGTLTLPKGASPTRRVPAVVTITGSGGQDRDEAISVFRGYRPFRELADALGRQGIAVLRMDDRGVGQSGGNHATATSADFANDIAAGLAFLRKRNDVDPARLGLMGHSEGGVIAPMVAEKDPALRAMVLLAGTSRTGRKILEFQLPNLVKGDTSLTKQTKDSALATIPAQIDSLANNPWMKFFLDYDPLTAARRVKTPVLVLNGATDQQVTPDQVPELVAAFKAAGNRDVTSHVFPGLNHLFVRDPDGFPGRYQLLPGFAVDSSAVKMVTDWLVKRLGPGVS